MASRYDSLLDRFHTIATTKQGTRYEILAAMIAKTLEENRRVIHDLKVRGDSDVKHQIDVTVEGHDGRKTLLIECKDFDTSEDRVGLSIVRDFWAVVDDTRPDSAWIITCNGFTSEALKFAKAKEIKPIIMRLFEDRDLNGRIARIVLNVHVLTPINPSADLHIDDVSESILRGAMAMAGIEKGISVGDDAHFIMPDGTSRHFVEVVSSEINDAVRNRTEGEARAILPPKGRRLVIAGTDIPYKGIVVKFGILSETITNEIVANNTAKLIIQGVGATDLIIFDDQIKRRRIDPATGEIS